ncbi:hypothetical protein [Spirosoma foliorum]|uniref:Uncharacterized protein n=1 Tax=Spirosoma foliorum TaxID=2710596 RepID=A0A7G5H544_9BACT|nr:hypothetical protein [Spirosoma foliorum]QMW06236.1 hypothetical protein H3H32_15800 [Spirosoma foliorum]
MKHLFQSQSERLNYLELVYKRLIQRTEDAIVMLNQLEQRQQENREKLAAVRRQCDELQTKIDAQKQA